MKSLIKVAALAMILTGMLTACGEEEAGLEKKKAKLAELRTEYTELGKEIEQLEKEIAELDTTSKQEVTSVPIRVQPLAPETFQHFIKVQGQVETENDIMVSPEMAGTISQILVEEGQTVRKGQVVAKLDDALLRKSMEELEVQITLARTLYQRQDTLWKQQIGSEVQLLQARTNLEALERRRATLQEQIRMSTVKAPIAGVVDQVISKTGQSAMPGMPMMQIVNLSELTFKAALSEGYIPYVKRGDKVSIDFSGIDKQLEAKVSNIGQTINPANRTVPVEVKLPGQHEMLKTNMTGEISINDYMLENAIVVHIQYIQKNAEGSFVMVAQRAKDGSGYTAHQAKVKTGRSYNGMVVVESGLSNGQLLITDGYQTLKEGDPVTFEGVAQNQ